MSDTLYDIQACTAHPEIYIHCVSKKLCQCYFLNNSLKHWPTLIIFGTQHHKETRSKWLEFCTPHLNTVATLPCEMQKS